MSDPMTRFCQTAASRMWLWRYRTKWRAKRVLKAMRFVIDRMSADDARSIMLDCERPAGWHPLLILTVEDIVEQARETFADHPELPRLIAVGCERVGCKWESHNDDLYEARRWAIELAEESAAREGIAPRRLDGGDALPRVKDASGIAEGGEP